MNHLRSVKSKTNIKVPHHSNMKYLLILRHTSKMYTIIIHPKQQHTHTQPQHAHDNAVYTAAINTDSISLWWPVFWRTHWHTARYILPNYWFLLWLEKGRYNKMMRGTHAHDYHESNRTPDVGMPAPACPSVRTGPPPPYAWYLLAVTSPLIKPTPRYNSEKDWEASECVP